MKMMAAIAFVYSVTVTASLSASASTSSSSSSSSALPSASASASASSGSAVAGFQEATAVWNSSEQRRIANISFIVTEAEKPSAISAEVLNQVRNVVQCIMAPIIVLFGVCANSLNIVVLSKRAMRSSTSVYLIALAAYDILYLLASAFNNVFGYCMQCLPSDLASYGIPISNLFSNTAVLIICTFSCERYIAVSYPIRGRIWCTLKRATMTTLCVCLTAALLTIPNFLPDRVQTQLDSAIGYGWINTTIFTYIPIFFLVICNALLIRVVFQASRLRKDMLQTPKRQEGSHSQSSNNRQSLVNGGTTSNNQDNQTRRSNSEQNKLTVMLIVVVIVFVVCQLPQAILYLSKRYYDAHNIKFATQTLIIRRIIGNFSNMLVQVNAASNFVLYSLFSTRFRATFRRTFCRCKSRSDSMTIATEVYGTIVQRSSPSYTQLNRKMTPCNIVELKSNSPRNESCRSRR